MVRTVDNSSVYLVSGSNKYPISDISTLGALYPLGGVSFVNQSYLDTKTTGPTMGRIIASSDGSIYFYDAGIKLPFGSCTQVTAYGSNCGAAILLEDSQINALINGPGMTNLFGTTSGKLFYINNGQKHEVYDNTSLTQANITDTVNTLNESAIGYLPYGSPVIRSNVVVSNRSSGQKSLYSNNTYYALSAAQANYSYIASLPKGVLDNTSLLAGQKSDFNGFVSSAATGNKYILMPKGKVQLTDPAVWGVSTATIDDSLVTALPTASDPINNGIVITPGDGTVYYVTGGKKRPVPGWGNLIDLKIQPFAINTIDSAQMNAIPTGNLIYAPGHMVKTADSATVYIVKNYTELLPISSFLFPQELGAASTLETMSSADFKNYTVSSAVQTQITCNGQDYVGTNGTLYPVSSTDVIKFGFIQKDFIDAGLLCGVLSKSAQAPPDFLLDRTGTIYLVQSGAKHAFTGYGAYLAHGGTPENTIGVSNYFTGLIPTGANISQ